ncbi:conserved hypothetical protein [Deferribacter desulfuricans SSM1]|uniref:Type IV pilus assembly protein PilX n=1 Tax=Deferribacter desulfuricans (strain DSM 14783 / JCM 11476 / NBRC 101012 / SSM1) TaxID=639282 RepID=D3PCL1_DEFDS|nr:hypothetical protein [Deferribacter desulfuricans]BAI80334.1 conserved hypothetical protein [Deferribacter desulfuricans SSM1]
MKKLVRSSKLNNKGIALLTTLILSLVALGFVAAIMYMLNSSTNISGTHKRYQNALMAARGASEYIMDKLVSGDEKSLCNNQLCTDNTTIDLNSLFSEYDVEATVLNRYEDTVNDIIVYSIRVNAINKNNPKEKSIIEFVYKVE